MTSTGRPSIRSLTLDEIEGILEALPFDIRFVDKENIFRYSNPPRVQPVPAAAYGRGVRECHKASTVPKVDQLISDLRTGQKLEAEFWREERGRFIYIHDVPVKNADGEYIGCLEIIQDATRIRSLNASEKTVENPQV